MFFYNPRVDGIIRDENETDILGDKDFSPQDTRNTPHHPSKNKNL